MKPHTSEPEGLVNTDLGDSQGEFIAYAGSAREVAANPGDGMVLCAKCLAVELKQIGVEFREAFQRVANAVGIPTGGQQRQTSGNQLLGAVFYFVPPTGHPAGQPPRVVTGSAVTGLTEGPCRPEPEVPGEAWRNRL